MGLPTAPKLGLRGGWNSGTTGTCDGPGGLMIGPGGVPAELGEVEGGPGVEGLGVGWCCWGCCHIGITVYQKLSPLVSHVGVSDYGVQIL